MPSVRELFQAAYTASNDRNFGHAIEIYRKCVKFDRHYSMAWNNLGWLLYDQYQEYEEARKCYEKALKEDKKNFYAWNNLGI
jgi:tetratricopeptide (TPR) repeat protein